MKKLLGFVLMLVMALCLSVSAFADVSVVATGDCGENPGDVIWTLYNDGKFVISGNGPMKSETSVYNYGYYEYKSKIHYVIVEDGVTSIGDNAFYCYNIYEVSIGNSVKSIGECAFFNSFIESLEIPNNVESIGEYAFTKCYKLKSLKLSENLRVIEAFSFYGCKALESIDIPQNVEIIGNNAFESCNSLTSIVIPDTVLTIKSFAFKNCTSLLSVTLSNNITKISNNLFDGCSNLESVTFSNNVKEIQSSAFASCNNLKDVYYWGTEEEYSNIEISTSWHENDCLLNATIHYLGVCNHEIIIDEGILPTCIEAGLTDGSHCSKCGEVIIAQEVIPSIEHVEEIVNGYDSTCTETGLTDGTICSECGEVIVAQDVIAETGHSMRYIGKIGKYLVYKCDICNEIEYVHIVTHIFDEIIDIIGGV